MKNLLTALFFVITFITYSQTPITDYNFSEAIKTCLTMSPGDGMCSSSEYGAMPDWDVSNVTNMKGAFNPIDMKEPKKIQVENNVVKILTAIRDNKNINAFELLDNMVNESDIKIRGYWMQLLLDLTNRSANSNNFYIKVSGGIRINAKDSVKILPAGTDYLLDPCSFYVSNHYMFKNHNNVGKSFKYKNNFNADISKWDVSNVTDMSYMFYGNDSFKQNISNWNVSKVTDMSFMFHMAGNPELIDISINKRSWGEEIGDIGRWDVSNVTNMRGMFAGSLFDKDISNWDVSKVIDMSFMFQYSIFNQNINNWDVSNVKNMRGMFSRNYHFNQNIGNWNVSNVEYMSLMFSGATAFNQNLNSWNVSNVKKMRMMFSSTLTINEFEDKFIGFNQDLGNWDVSNVTDMTGMFEHSNFNKDIGKWNVGNVKNMTNMFNGAIFFNQDISSWDVSNVINMRGMFYFALEFNQNIGSWDVSNVINMSHLFFFDKTKLYNPAIKLISSRAKGLTFNQDISNWNVINVMNMTNMFYGASSFNQDLGRWNVNNVKTAYLFVDDKNNQWKQNKPKFNNLIKFYKVLRNKGCNEENDYDCYVYLPESFVCNGNSITRSSDTNYEDTYSIGNSINFKLVKNNLCLGIVQKGIIKDINYTNHSVDFNQYNNDSQISQYVLTNDNASNNSNDYQKCYSPYKIKDFK